MLYIRPRTGPSRHQQTPFLPPFFPLQIRKLSLHAILCYRCLSFITTLLFFLEELQITFEDLNYKQKTWFF